MSWECEVGVSDDCAEGDVFDAPCEVNGKDSCIACMREVSSDDTD